MINKNKLRRYKKRIGNDSLKGTFPKEHKQNVGFMQDG